MAALQKIRSSSWILILMGVGMFLFILTMVLDSNTLSAITNSNRNVGSVYGKSLSQEDFSKMVDEASTIMKLQSGTDNLTDEQMEQIRNQVWGEYVQFELMKHECDQLGLLVTDKEVAQALRQGTAQAFRNVPMFIGEDQHFNYTQLQTFFKQVKGLKGKKVDPQMAQQIEMIQTLWNYTEKQLRRELLMQKYQTFFIASITINPVSAKSQFSDRVNTTNALVAALPYGTISDKEIKVSDSDLKAAYAQYKPLFANPQEVRDLKYIDVQVTASPADKKALEIEMKGLYDKLQAGADPSAVVNASKSVVKFVDLPLAGTSFLPDIKMQLDSMAVGTTKAPYYNEQDNTMNIVKLISKVQAPDSICFRAIPVVAKTPEAMSARADSILKALERGAKYVDIAKKNGIPADSTWLSASQFETGQLSAENAKFVHTLYDTPLHKYTIIDIQGSKAVLQVMDRKAMKTKYVAAIVKVPVDFSKATYDAAVNQMNKFLSGARDLDQLIKNAPKSGYQVQNLDHFVASSGLIGGNSYMPGIRGSKVAVKWAFDEAKEGQISPLYEIGEANNHLLVVGLSKIYKKGYLPLEDSFVKNYLSAIVKSQKKGEIAAKKLAGVKNLEAAKAKGAIVDSLNNVTFAQGAVVPAVGIQEPALTAAITTGKKGTVTAPVIGTGGAYISQILEKGLTGETFDAKTEMQMQQRALIESMSRAVFSDLAKKAKVQDCRYKF